MSKTSSYLLLLPLLAFCIFGNVDHNYTNPLGAWFLSSLSLIKVAAIIGTWVLAMFSVYSLKESCDSKYLKKAGRNFLTIGVIASVILFVISYLSNLSGNVVPEHSLAQILTVTFNTGFLISSVILALRSIFVLSK